MKLSKYRKYKVDKCGKYSSRKRQNILEIIHNFIQSCNISILNDTVWKISLAEIVYCHENSYCWKTLEMGEWF